MVRPAGINFPFINHPSGFPKLVLPDAIYAQSIEQILLTRKGERVMLPEFGSNLLKYLFENNDQSTANAVIDEVRDAIARWDDRIIVTDVRVERDETVAKIAIKYRIFNRDLEHILIVNNNNGR